MSYELIATLDVLVYDADAADRDNASLGPSGLLPWSRHCCLWGDKGGFDIGFSAAMKLMKWYPLLTLPMFIFMGYVLSESKIADDLIRCSTFGWAAYGVASPLVRLVDGPDFGHERAECCGHGHRLNHRAA